MPTQTVRPSKTRRAAAPSRSRSTVKAPGNTVHASKLKTIRMVSGQEDKTPKVVDNGDVKQWVGFGWVNEGPAESPRDDHLPRVVRD